MKIKAIYYESLIIDLRLLFGFTGLAEVEESEIPLQIPLWQSQCGSCTCNRSKEACLRHPVVFTVPLETWSEGCASPGGSAGCSYGKSKRVYSTWSWVCWGGFLAWEEIQKAGTDGIKRLWGSLVGWGWCDEFKVWSLLRSLSEVSLAGSVWQECAPEQLRGHQLLICDTLLVSNISYLLKAVINMKYLENKMSTGCSQAAFTRQQKRSWKSADVWEMLFCPRRSHGMIWL